MLSSLGTSRRAVILLLLIALWLPAAAAQQTPLPTGEVDREARTLFTEVMSPFCPGLTLSVCPSPGAVLMKDSLQAALRSGQTRAEVLDSLEARYGPEILARPRPKGFGLLAWIGALGPMVVAGAFVSRWLRRAGPDRSASPVAPSGLDAESQRRLDEALRQDP